MPEHRLRGGAAPSALPACFLRRAFRPALRRVSGPASPNRRRFGEFVPTGLLTFAFAVFAASFGAAQANDGETGMVAGVVRDGFNGMTLPSAPVTVVSTGRTVYTELDGGFRVRAPAGPQEIRVSFGGYTPRVLAVEVAAGETARLEVVLEMERFTEEVVVTAEAVEAELFTAEAQLVERQKAAAITDNLASEEMKENADSNAASAMKRVTGLTVVDNQYVFVRGLGERYSNTTLNGAVLPTTEPDKRVVPLDLFPTGLIESVSVVKSYLPDKPADFSGGLVEIDPLSFPSEPVLSFSMSQGMNSRTSFRDGLGYAGGARDWLGFDDGTRGLPAAIPNERAVRTSRFTNAGFTPSELEAMGESFANVWSPETTPIRQDQSFSFVAGNSWDRFGAIVSGTWSESHQNQDEERNFYAVSAGDLEIQNEYDFATTTSKTSTGLVGNLAYRFSGHHRMALENFYTHNSKNEARIFQGYNNDVGEDIRNTRLFWVEETIFSSTLSGEHFLPGLASSQLEWKATLSRAARDEPDLRETLYEYNPAVEDFVLADESQSGFRMFNDLDDEVRELGFDWSAFFTQWSGLPAMFKFGPSLTLRERDFRSRRFRLNPRIAGAVDLTAEPEEIFTPENIGSSYELREETRPTDTYGAEQTVTAAYGMLDLPLGRNLRVIGGVRVERSRQQVDTFDPFSTTSGTITARLEDTDLLPGVNAVYALTDRTNLRASYSHTVNRPEFRELAPFEFTDVVGGRAVVGNPDLQRALIRNLDLRFETFSGAGEVLAASVFYKDFSNPIERIVQPTAQLRTSYTNAVGARNAGVELESRQQFGRLTGSANYTYVDSRIELEAASGEVQTNLGRPLAGQSAHVFNLSADLDLPEVGGSFRVLYNYFGERIVDVGSLGMPDIYEEGRGSLDAVFSKKLASWSLRASFDNLLDAEHRFTQGGKMQRTFGLGRSFSLSVSYAVR